MISIIATLLFHFFMMVLSFLVITAAKYQLDYIDKTKIPAFTIYLLKIEYLLYVLPILIFMIGIKLMKNIKKGASVDINSQKIDFSIAVITLSVIIFIFSVLAGISPFLKFILRIG